VGARALLAFRGTYERDPEDPTEPSVDALTGAVMESQAQVALLNLEKLFRKAWFK
jgi:hypothetical protein